MYKLLDIIESRNVYCVICCSEHRR